MSTAPPCRGPVLRLTDLTLTWSGRPAVHHLSGDVHPGEWLAVVGPNGAGKSTLLRALAGELQPASGRIEWRGVDPGSVAVLAQESGVDRSFPITVRDWLSLGDWPRSGAFGASASAEAVAMALEALGLAGFESRSLDALSGGQFQRLRLARVALMDCPVVLLDEPFNAVDTRTTDDLLDLLRRWSVAGRTVVLVTHDLDLVRRHVPRTLLLARDPLAWSDTGSALTPERLARARAMSQDWRAEAPWCGPAVEAIP